MSQEIICLSSSDDEDTRMENSNKINKKFNNVLRKRRLSDSSLENKIEVKKQKISNGVVDIDYEEKSTSKSKFNLKNKKSVTFETTTRESGNKSTKKRSPSPVAGTSKYFDLIEKKVPKKNACNKKEEKRSTTVSQNSKASRKVSCDESEEEHSTSPSEKSIKRIKPQLIVKEIVPIPDPSEDVFEKILETCKNKKDSTVEVASQKIKKYYDELGPTDKNCEEFRLFLNSILHKISNSTQFYKYLLDMKNEIIRRITKKKNIKNDNEAESEEIELTEDEAMKVEKLQSVIKQCKKKIERLENQEVDFDEEDNSAYIMVDRYKKKLVQLCSELSRIAKDNMLKKQIHKRLLKRKDINDEMTGIIYVDEAIIRFINTSIKQANELKHITNPNVVAAYVFFPDYVDILQCIKQCNEERELGLKYRKMEKLAEKAFKAVGNYLKNQRLQETKDYLLSFVETCEVDPAKNNHNLSKKLKNNKEIGMKKLEGIFAKYVAKQDGLSSEGSVTENEEHDSCEDESSDNNSIDKKGDISFSANEDDASSRDESKSFDKDKISVESLSRKSHIAKISSDDESKENVDIKRSIKKSRECIRNQPIKERYDDANSSIVENTSSNKKLTNSTDLNKLCSESIEGVIEILSDSSATSKESNGVKLKESSQDIVLQLEDEDSPSISKNNVEQSSTDNDTLISNETCAVKEIDNKRISVSESFDEKNTTKRDSKDNNVNNSSKITVSKNSDKKNPTEKDSEKDTVTDSSQIAASKNSDEKRTTEKDFEKDNDNDFRKISVSKNSDEKSNVEKDSEKVNDNDSRKINVSKNSDEKSTTEKDSEKDNHNDSGKTAVSKNSDEKSTAEKDSEKDNDTDSRKIAISKNSDEKRTTEKDSKKDTDKILISKVYPLIQSESDQVSKTKEESRISNKKKESADEILVVTREPPPSFLKVKSFAKPPESWKDKSPEKPPKLSIHQPIKQVLQQMSRPECVDLTNESEVRSSSTRFLNPLALKKRRVPVNKLVVVKNVVNNYNISLPTDGVRDNRKTVPVNKMQFVSPQANKSILIPKKSSVQVNQVSPNNHNQRSNDSSVIVRTPFVTQQSMKKKNNNTDLSSIVK